MTSTTGIKIIDLCDILLLLLLLLLWLPNYNINRLGVVLIFFIVKIFGIKI